ncbi:MAG: protein kinase [Myxococcota bacterium]
MTSESLEPGPPPLVPAGEVIADRWVVGHRVAVHGDVHLHDLLKPDEMRIALFRYRGSEPLPRFIEALQRDAAAWGALKPTDGRMPVCVPTPDVGRIVNHTVCYWVQEHPRGPSLAERLEVTPTLTPKYACALARQVGDALEMLHGLQLVHGALEPGNVHLLGNSDWVRLAWGGLSARLEWAGMDAGRAGLAEVAPEVLGGAPSSPRSDLYALGALLFRMVAGQPPWLVRRKGPTPGVTDDDPLPPLPPWAESLAPVVGSALRRDPHERPESVRDWLDRLAELEAAFSDAEAPLGTWAPDLPLGAEPTPPTVNRTVLPAEQRSEEPDPVLSNTPPSGIQRVFTAPVPASVQSMVPASPRSLGPPLHDRGTPVGVPVSRLSPPAQAAPATAPWWMPWVLVGGLLGTLVFFVVLFVAYEAWTQPMTVQVPVPVPVPVPAAPPAAPPPAPAIAELTIESDPPGAEVVDATGAVVGRTPVGLPFPQTRAELTYRVRLPGYSEFTVKQPWSSTSMRRLVHLEREVTRERPRPRPEQPDLRKER